MSKAVGASSSLSGVVLFGMLSKVVCNEVFAISIGLSESSFSADCNELVEVFWSKLQIRLSVSEFLGSFHGSLGYLVITMVSFSVSCNSVLTSATFSVS